MRLKRYITILLFIIFIFTGCSKDTAVEKYTESAKRFNAIYFKTVECINLSDTMSSLKELNSDENKKNIEELKNLLEDIENILPKDKERFYDSFKNRYEELVFLRESYDNFNKLTQEDRGRIDRIFISIGLNKENWKDKNSTIVWQ